MEKELTCFEVETKYKSGRKKTEIISAETEENMWKIYDRIHRNPNLIESSTIADAYPN